jgi:uncharacterized membrane protein
MEALLILLALYLFVVLLIFPIWAYIKSGDLSDRNELLQHRITELEIKLEKLRSAPTPAPAAKPEPAPTIAAAAAAVPTPPVVVKPVPPPVAPVVPPAQPTPVFASTPVAAAEIPPLLPPVIAAPAKRVIPPPVYVPPPPKPSWMDNINWEQFMGVKLFAWLGALALFLGVAFFVKYSFEHGWIPPAVRAAMGFVFGAGLVVGGLRMVGPRYTITAHSLIAAGIVSLYAVTFACRSVYHFEFFGVVPTFLLMSLITTTAFVLAVRLEAQVVAILGLLGGFLTPILINTGVDNPVGLFGYIGCLNVGLLAVALHRRWFYLVPLGATGTILMMVGWAEKFYAPEKTVTAMVVTLSFSALFIAAAGIARRLGRSVPLLGQTALVMPLVAFGFAWFFLGYPEPAARTALFFGYVALAGFGLLYLAWREQLGGLVAGAAGLTALLMIRWNLETFTAAQAPVVVTVCLAFSALYFITYLFARWRQMASAPVLWAAIGLPAIGLGFALFLMDNAAVGARPGLLFTFIIACDALLLALAWLDDRVPRLHLAAGMAVFALLSVWTARHLTDGLLPWALAMYLVFAALHAAFPLLLERKYPAAAPTWWSQLFPPLTLALLLIPIFKLEGVPLFLWVAILLVDLIAIGLAVVSASLLAVVVVLGLTLAATGVCIMKVPAAMVFAPSLLLVIGFFAVFFFAASIWLVRRLGNRLATDTSGGPVLGDMRAQLPAFASLLPFLLLIMACARLTVPDPSAVFGLGLLLVLLTLGLARLLVVEWLPACALAGMAALQFTWHARHFDPAAAGVPLVWYGAFYTVFAAYPFIFRRQFAGLTGPWAVAALSGVAHFWMAYQAIKPSWPADFLGAVPALFAVAPLASLAAILKSAPASQPARLNQLAWFGGVGLFFITLIFPIQFERQWLTVAWALEGAALLWLFHRVPHPGLRATGAALLVTAFARLALNPAVLGYHVRGDTPILNWYLYAYGVAAAALFAAARLSAPPRERIFGLNAPAIFNALGVILAFLLLNIEIADYFTAPGTRALAFQFSGNFARDMSYTIGWALFALALLSAGIWQASRAARYAAIALLSVALVKLFFHDLARLEALYRIGALFAVAVIAILASLAYQRFLPGNEKTPPSTS